jgi:transcriptional regulator with XRE-family HTH domain
MNINSNPTPLLSLIINQAKARGVSQKALARQAGIPEETLSRAKRRGSVGLEKVQALAGVLDLQLGLVDARGALASTAVASPDALPPKPMRFRQRYASLAWSNPNATDATLIRRALLRPGLQVLLDAALEFGVERLSQEWAALKAEDSAESRQAAPITERLLAHIALGHEHAQA